MRSMDHPLQLLNPVRPQIRQRLALGDRPEVLHRIEFGSIRRQPFHRQPGGIGFHILLDTVATVGRQTVPQKRHPTGYLLMQGFQIGDHGVFFDRLRLQMQQKIGRTPIRLTDQRSQRIEAFPVEAMFDEGRLPTRRPGSANTGFERESTLIVERQFGRLLFCPFFIRGQSSASH